MKLKGHITVFLSLILLCVCGLLCGLLESARMAGARCYLQIAANSALDSVFSQYHRGLWDHYRLMFGEYENKEEIEADFSRWMTSYLETKNWYPMETETVAVEQMLTAVANGGDYLEQEILDYMKYGIWNLDFDPTLAGQLKNQAKEAAAVTEIANIYRGNTKAAWKLEQALDKISQSLEEQRTEYERAVRSLNRYDGDEFRHQAKEMIAGLKQIPKQIETYRKRADALGDKLMVSREQFTAKKEELGEAASRALEDEIGQYESYTREDGERRLEIESLDSWSREQILVVESAIERAEEVEDIINDWDDEDEEEPDLDELWGSVEQVFSVYQLQELSFSHGVKDREKQGLLEQLEAMAGNGLLSLVLPEGAELSKGNFDASEFPSVTERASGGNRNTSLADRLLIEEYCGRFFTHFLSEEKKEVQYELEYLLGEKTIDEENLYQAVLQILTLREGMNLIHILSDPTKREEARTLAALIVGAAAPGPLVFVTAFFIMSIWALGESVMDVRMLLEGKKVVLFKTGNDWKLDLEGLLKMGKEGIVRSGEGQDSGLSYPAYLKLLLFMKNSAKQNYLMMDIMQLNIRRKQSSFRMKNCVYGVDIQSQLCGKHVFLSLGFVEKLSGNTDHTYPLTVHTQKSY